MAVPTSADVRSLWPVWGLTAVIGLSLVAEGAVASLETVLIPDGYWIGFLSSILVVFGLGYATRRIPGSELSTARYPRLNRWCFAGASGFLLINVGFMATMPTESAFQIFGWVRWAIGFGGGIGFAIGLFEARAIDREVATERIKIRQSELKRERDRLEEFASVVSHDLRNPLNVVNGRLDLARRDHPDDEHLAAIEPALDRMDETVDVDLEAHARDSWERVDTADAELRVIDTTSIRADRDRLSHVFENLFRNAVEHGGDAVSVRVGTLDDPAGFYVEDDGPGIPADERERVLETGYTSSRAGSGFGLAIVRRIVDAHGWDLRVTGAENGGARFEVDGVTTAAS